MQEAKGIAATLDQQTGKMAHITQETFGSLLRLHARLRCRCSRVVTFGAQAHRLQHLLQLLTASSAAGLVLLQPEGQLDQVSDGRVRVKKFRRLQTGTLTASALPVVN